MLALVLVQDWLSALQAQPWPGLQHEDSLAVELAGAAAAWEPVAAAAPWEPVAASAAGSGPPVTATRAGKDRSSLVAVFFCLARSPPCWEPQTA